MISNVRLKSNNIDSDPKIPCNWTSQIGGTCIYMRILHNQRNDSVFISSAWQMDRQI